MERAEKIESLEALHALYGRPGAAALRKVARQMTPLYREWIMASRFCVLSTVGPEGTDASPRGEDGPVVLELDPSTLAMPDWRGNNRLDSLRNIVADGRVSLMFMIPGSNNVVRLNGTAWLTCAAQMRDRFAKGDRLPATVIIVEIGEIYTQCARAMMRAGVWDGMGRPPEVPTVGEILAEVSDGEEGGAPYDEAWGARAAQTMW